MSELFNTLNQTFILPKHLKKEGKMFKGLKDRLSNEGRTPPSSQNTSRNSNKGGTPGGSNSSYSTPVGGRRTSTSSYVEDGNDGNISDSSTSSQQPSASSGFFKRLEFLTPLKDQMANKINESRESLNSLVEGQRKQQQEQSPTQMSSQQQTPSTKGGEQSSINDMDVNTIT